MKVAVMEPGGSGGSQLALGMPRLDVLLVFFASRSSRDAGLGVLGTVLGFPGWFFLGSSPRFALKRSEPEQLRLCPRCLSFGAGGRSRSAFAPRLYPALPGFGRNPREGFWHKKQNFGAACLGTGRDRCAGSTGLGRDVRPVRTNLWHRGLGASTSGCPVWDRTHLEGRIGIKKGQGMLKRQKSLGALGGFPPSFWEQRG